MEILNEKYLKFHILKNSNNERPDKIKQGQSLSFTLKDTLKFFSEGGGEKGWRRGFSGKV